MIRDNEKKNIIGLAEKYSNKPTRKLRAGIIINLRDH